MGVNKLKMSRQIKISSAGQIQLYIHVYKRFAPYLTKAVLILKYFEASQKTSHDRRSFLEKLSPQQGSVIQASLYENV